MTLTQKILSSVLAVVAIGFLATGIFLSDNSNSITTTEIQHLNDYIWPKNGNYYVKQASDLSESPETLLRDLRDEGVKATHVWHRSSTGTCQPANGGPGMDVVVPSVAFVRTANSWGGAPDRDFTPIDEPSFFLCPYNVIVYTWE